MPETSTQYPRVVLPRRHTRPAVRSATIQTWTVVHGLYSVANRFVALLLLVATAPVVALIALVIRLDSAGPAIYRQRRLGLNGRVFEILKFRSMYADAEERLQRILDSDPILKAEYEIFHKLRRDPRITRVGKWLRRWSADELPQLWNVVQGQMDLVGPRAYLPAERTKMGTAGRTILERRPGLTGLWQVSGRNQLPFSRRVELDAFYVQNRTVRMDLSIVARTVGVVLSGQGAG